MNQQRVEQLTEREFEVLTHIGQGQNNRDVASSLDISPRTVELYRSRLMKKLEIDSSISLLLFAHDYVVSHENGPEFLRG